MKYFIITDNQLIFVNDILRDYCNGYMNNDVLVLDKSLTKITYNQIKNLCPKKVYIMQANRRLGRKYKFGSFDEFMGYNGAERNPSNWEPYGQMRLVVPDLQDKIENNAITKIQYGPSISRVWEIEQPNDHAEWLLQDSR